MTINLDLHTQDVMLSFKIYKKRYYTLIYCKFLIFNLNNFIFDVFIDYTDTVTFKYRSRTNYTLKL